MKNDSRTSEGLEANLKALREVIDTNIEGVDMDTVLEYGKRLSSIVGLSAECMAAAQKRLQLARLQAIKNLEGKDISASVLLRMADAECGIEISTYEYAERLNAGITHQLDFVRTLISLHKTELENSLK